MAGSHAKTVQPHKSEASTFDDGCRPGGLLALASVDADVSHCSAANNSCTQECNMQGAAD